MNRPEIMLDYLVNCSSAALDNVIITQRNKAQERKKIACEAMKEAVEAEAIANFAEWIKENGPAIISMGMEKAS